MLNTSKQLLKHEIHKLKDLLVFINQYHAFKRVNIFVVKPVNLWSITNTTKLHNILTGRICLSKSCKGTKTTTIENTFVLFAVTLLIPGGPESSFQQGKNHLIYTFLNRILLHLTSPTLPPSLKNKLNKRVFTIQS